MREPVFLAFMSACRLFAEFMRDLYDDIDNRLHGLDK